MSDVRPAMSAALTDEDRRRAVFQSEVEEWRRKLERTCRFNIGYPLFLALLQLRGLWSGEFFWGEWLVVLVLIGWSATALGFRWRLRRLAGNQSPREPGRLRALLRERRRFTTMNLIFLPPLVFGFGLLSAEMFGAGEVEGVACGAAAFAFFGWWICIERRNAQARLRHRLRAIWWGWRGPTPAAFA